jgi:hypothetical protein
VVTRDLPVDLGPTRSQIETRADQRFARLRTEVLKLVMDAPGASSPADGPAR